MRAGLIVSCESAREINEIMINRMLQAANMEQFATALATLTGGSGAVAVVLSDGSFSKSTGHRLLGASLQVAPEHHALCRWGLQPQKGSDFSQFMSTDSVSVLKHGVELGRRTWGIFLKEMNWTANEVDRVICHQVGSEHQKSVLKALGIAESKDFTTYQSLGNIGTVSLPITAALAQERGVLKPDDSVAFLGIGSGLNCLMMGLKW
jgi:3-oxoacyl-[acyl-carrier-protein] synthase-3